MWSARTTFFVLRPAVFSDCLRSPTRYCAKTSFFRTTSDSFHHASVFFSRVAGKLFGTHCAVAARKCVFFARCRKVVRHSLRSGCDRSRGARVERKNDVSRVATGCLQRLPEKPHEILRKDFILSDNVRFLPPRKCVFSRVAGKLFGIHCAVAAIDPEVLVWSARTTFFVLRPAVFSDCLRSPTRYCAKTSFLPDNVRLLSPRKCVFSRVAGKLFGIHCAVADRSRGARVERKNDVFRVATGCLQLLPEKPDKTTRDFISLTTSDSFHHASFSRVAGKLFGIHCAVAAIDPEVLVWSARTTFFVLRPAVFSDCPRSPTRQRARISFLPDNVRFLSPRK